jgi:hypothetical protein
MTAIYELRLSEIGRVAKSEKIWADCTFQHKSGSWKKSPWPPQKLWIQKMQLTNSAFCWLLIRPISTHGLVAKVFWIQATMVNCFGQFGHWNKILDLGVQNEWILTRLVMDFAASWPSFSTHTHTHDFDNHNNGYGRSKTVFMWS